MTNGEKLDEKFSNLFENLLNHYKKTGKIGYVQPVNLAHARQIAYMAAKNIIHKQELKKIEKQINTISPSRETTEGFTGCQNCVQLNLF